MRSMTGCGRSQQSSADWEVAVEVRTVNHRFLDLSCRLPRTLSFLEETVRKGVSAGMKRGHADVFVSVRSLSGGDKTVRVDEPLAAAYDAAALRLGALTGRESDVTVSSLMRLEGVLTVEEAAPDEEALTALCAAVLAEAMAQLDKMRLREGENLRADLSAHLDAAEALRRRIAERAPAVVEEYRARLTARLARLPIEPVEPQRLAQEVALMADRCAIDEELSRLLSHIGQLRAYLDAPGEIGKKLDFLIQEMNREANTIGSKASDAQIAQWVVDLKSEIEKLREQVQNVE